MKRSIYLSLLSLFASLLGFVNQLVIANFFGASKYTDVFFSLTSMPAAAGALLSLALSYTLMPLLKKISLQQNSNAFISFENSFRKYFIKLVSYFYVACYVMVILVQYYFLHYPFTAQNFAISTLAFFTAYLNVMQLYFSVLHNLNDKFFITVIVSWLPPLGSVFCIYFFNHSLSLLSVQLGLFLGTILSCIWLVIKLDVFRHTKDYLNAYVEDIEAKKSLEQFIKVLPYVTIAMLCFTVYQPIDAFWGKWLPESTISYYAYLQRIVVVVATVVVSGPGMLLVPKLTTLYVQKQQQEFNIMTNKILRLVVLVSVFITVVLMATKVQILSLVFQSKKYVLADINNLANIFPYMLVGMCIMLTYTILLRIAFISQSSNKMYIYGLLSSVIYFVISGLFSKIFPMLGFSYAYIITWLIVFFVALVHTAKNNQNNFLLTKVNAFFIIKLIVASFVTVYFANYIHCFLVNKTFIENDKLNHLFTAIVIGVIASVTWLIVIIKLFKIKDLDIIYQALKKK